jgi:hypothetical protein
MKEETSHSKFPIIKYLLVILVAAFCLYKATPRYFFTDKGHIRCDRFSGKVQESLGQDPDTGEFIFERKNFR